MQLPMAKVKDFIYEIQHANTDQGRPISRLIKLGLSGNALMIRQGGGYFDFLEYLDRKGFLN